MFLDLPPYMFCDEEQLFYADVINMLRSESAASNMFRSGPMNVYPMLLIAWLTELLVPLTDLEVLFIGRVVLPFGLGALAVIPIALFLKYLTGLRYVGLIAAVLYVSSSFLTSISRYWYPDHYMFFFASLVAMLTARLFVVRRPWPTALLLGLAFSMMISVKYHSAALALMVILAFVQRYFEFSQSQQEKKATRHSFFIFSVSAVLFTLVIHANSLINFQSFVEQQLFNVNNYGQVVASPFMGAVAYAFVAFLFTAGPIGAIAIVLGVGGLVRSRRYWTLALLCVAPAALIVVLGFQGLFVSRNIVPATPLLIALASLGIMGVVTWISKPRSAAYRNLTVGLSAVIILGQLSLTFYSFVQDLRPDSRVIAQTWIEKNIPTHERVGTNQFCFGASAATIAGRETVIDSSMEEGLNYYVFDSYSPSTIVTNFRGESASIAFLEPKYLHFYFLDDKKLFSALPGLLFKKPDYIPEGYSLVKKFEQNGPEVWILEKD